jgi:hypothetical protein
MSDNPVYFNPSNRRFGVKQLGSLPDTTFIGTLMAMCVYPKRDLMENIFASRPDDFMKYGLYTCRFYVDGEWVEVITDTNIPSIKDIKSGKYFPAYGGSNNSDELWIPFVEKAFAKAMGSYQEIPNIKVQKALLHLTGGSVQQTSIKDETTRLDSISDSLAWSEFKKRLQDDSLVLMVPAASALSKATTGDGVAAQDSVELDGTNEDSTSKDISSSYFVPDMLYSVVLCKDLGGFELVLMHNPWSHPDYSWTGEWSDSSNDWELNPALLAEIGRDSSIPWRKNKPNGYFWISFRNMVKYFTKSYTCKLFSNEKYRFYCVRGESRGRHAGGPLSTLRDMSTVLQEAVQSKSHALRKSTAATVMDGDSSWFNNPQYRISCSVPTTVFVSVVPLGAGEAVEHEHDQASNMFVTLTSSVKGPTVPMALWEVTDFEVLATDRSNEAVVRNKGQETCIWGAKLDPRKYHHIVANTIRRGVEGECN